MTSREDVRWVALVAFGFAAIVLCFALLARGSWWFLVALVPVGAVFLAVCAHRRMGWPPPSSPRVRALVRWIGSWLLPVAFVGNALWPDDAARGPGWVLGAVSVFVVFSALLAAFQPHVETTPPPWAHRPGHELSWARRREIARAVRAGDMLPAARDADVRAVIDRMLYWEIVGWVAALVAFALAAFAAVAVARGGPVLVLAASAGLAVLVTVVVLRRIAATKRHLARLDALRPLSSDSGS